MNLCKEAALRASMGDDEFWDHVYHGPWHVPPADGDDDWWLPEDGSLPDSRRCLECGATGECGRDEEDRPWTHALSTVSAYSDGLFEDGDW